MGLHKLWQVNIVIVSLFALYMSSTESINLQRDPDYLRNFILRQANEQVPRPRSGIVYNISLPPNFSGMEASVVRIRTRTFWLRGFNFSSFEIPPRILPNPMANRMAIVYGNLGNWSSFYYNVPNHTFAAPVLGIMAYNSSSTNLVGKEKLNFNISRDPIKILFPKRELLQGKNETPICVEFGDGGSVEFSNMSEPFVCLTKSLGRYSLVVPYVQTQSHGQNNYTTWWVIGFVIGFVILVFLVLVLAGSFKVMKNTRMRKMEQSSERGEGLNTYWVGESRMPSATMTRTQPSLEDD